MDMTARWYQFSAADQMMEQWLDAVVATHSPTSVLSYARSCSHGPRSRPWIAVRLLERSLVCQDWGSAKLTAQVLRSKALQELNETLQNLDSVKTRMAKAQAAWVASSYGVDNVAKALQESLREASHTFSSLNEPTEEQEVLKSQLDAIAKALAKPEGASSSGRQLGY